MPKSFSYRALISVLMVSCFFVLAVSGLCLYFAPHGPARGWSFLALVKRDWRDLHIVFGFSFIAVGAAHVFFNRKPLFSYFRKSGAQGRVKMEPLTAFLLGALAAAFALLGA
ncbi:MAG: DUF4405 domain-containing protein [Bdellovibrionales bacterium]